MEVMRELRVPLIADHESPRLFERGSHPGAGAADAGDTVRSCFIPNTAGAKAYFGDAGQLFPSKAITRFARRRSRSSREQSS